MNFEDLIGGNQCLETLELQENWELAPYHI